MKNDSFKNLFMIGYSINKLFKIDKVRLDNFQDKILIKVKLDHQIFL